MNGESSGSDKRIRGLRLAARALLAANAPESARVCEETAEHLEHLSAASTPAPIGKVLSEEEMGVGYDRKSGDVLWWNKPKGPALLYAAPSSAVPLVEKIEELQRAVPPEEWDKLPRSSERRCQAPFDHMAHGDCDGSAAVSHASTRDEIIEECAKVIERRAHSQAEKWQNVSEGYGKARAWDAQMCAVEVRALKNTPIAASATRGSE